MAHQKVTPITFCVFFQAGLPCPIRLVVSA
nr:MAG TPA: hypothetical protein [Bacteriophage sp.]DAN21259.1 MAG TPA_asm: hypothetical protein [Bacteriophage sp.]DAO54240.1 MAG TPA: hypothetical protein [Caudoviricetes sp.]